uniref:Asialoglycoprotein receptor-like 1 n=1 Tax=Amphilophus citrinellus TaxID=61819 RepID=A0A3Q0SDU5_AMPCI
MESQYHQFGSSDSSSAHEEPKILSQTGNIFMSFGFNQVISSYTAIKRWSLFVGMKRIVIFVLYGLLVLLLLILLMVTGIKCTTLVQIEFYFYSQNVSILIIIGTCAEGWVSYQSHCYLLATTSVTWSKAEDLCKAHGGHLLVLNNVEELVSSTSFRHNYWIGLVERQHEGQWSWKYERNIKTDEGFWDKGQPDDWDYRENGEDCGQLHGSERRKRKLLNDAECTQSYRYICEKRA